MRKSTVAFVVPLLLVLTSAHAAEMFEAYPEKCSLGYVSNEVDLRYWLNPAWGLDLGVGFNGDKSRTRTDDGVISADDRRKSNGYSFSAAGVRTIKNFEYFDLNLKGGVSYAYDKSHDNPEGPNNDVVTNSRSYSVFVGPEVEIKLPYFSRLVIVSSIQAAYRVEKDRTWADGIFSPTTTKDEASDFTFRSDGNSLNELFHIGLRYYF